MFDPQSSGENDEVSTLGVSCGHVPAAAPPLGVAPLGALGDPLQPAAAALPVEHTPVSAVVSGLTQGAQT
jgi:hypothetical protein